jgi:CcmD family protein
MDARNFTYMFYGFAAVYLVLGGYVVSLVAREHKLDKQIETVRKLVEDREAPE